MRYWLMKSEPEVYSIDHLKRDQNTLWTGVRNYQARNYMTQSMQLGDQAFFYHSNAEPTGIAGLMTISGPAAPDPEALNKKSENYDPKSTKEKPIWECVEVSFAKKFKTVLPLSVIKAEKALAKMVLLQKGSRLSVQPVTEDEFKILMKMLESH